MRQQLEQNDMGIIHSASVLNSHKVASCSPVVRPIMCVVHDRAEKGLKGNRRGKAQLHFDHF